MNIQVSSPLVASVFAIPPYNVTPQDYNQDIAADGGYKSATISFPVDPIEVDFWLSYGLGCHVESFGDSTEKIWEGFINQLSLNLGSVSFSQGPLMNVANRVTVRYTDFTTGQAARTTAANDTTSQARYGIWHKVLATSSMSSTSAEKIRATYLQENAWPELTPNISSMAGEPILTLNCLGYLEWLNYPYNQATDTTYTHREKVLEVIGQSPNAIFSSDYNFIEANSLSVNRLDNDDRLGLTIIQELVALGGSGDNARRLFGVYDNRTIKLQAIPSTAEYSIKTSEPGMVRSIYTGAPVEPYNIRPGKWLHLQDFLPGIPGYNSPRQDPRLIFIESVTFTAPYDFTINGGKIGTVTQQLAKLAFGG